jgi:hypothetical protein
MFRTQERKIVDRDDSDANGGSNFEYLFDFQADFAIFQFRNEAAPNNGKISK